MCVCVCLCDFGSCKNTQSAWRVAFLAIWKFLCLREVSIFTYKQRASKGLLQLQGNHGEMREEVIKMS